MRTETDRIGDAHEPFWAGEAAEEGDGLVASIGLGAAWTVQSLCSFSPQDSQPHAPASGRLDQPFGFSSSVNSRWRRYQWLVVLNPPSNAHQLPSSHLLGLACFLRTYICHRV